MRNFDTSKLLQALELAQMAMANGTVNAVTMQAVQDAIDTATVQEQSEAEMENLLVEARSGLQAYAEEATQDTIEKINKVLDDG